MKKMLLVVVVTLAIGLGGFGANQRPITTNNMNNTEITYTI